MGKSNEKSTAASKVVFPPPALPYPAQVKLLGVEWKPRPGEEGAYVSTGRPDYLLRLHLRKGECSGSLQVNYPQGYAHVNSTRRWTIPQELLDDLANVWRTVVMAAVRQCAS